MDLIQSAVLAIGLGLLGFVEPCSVGSHLIFIRTMKDWTARQRLMQTLLFTLSRALLMAGLGIAAALIGGAFEGFQYGFWAALGSLYVVLGLLYLAGGAGWLIKQLNRALPDRPGTGSSLALGTVFGFNIPACAAPLLAVLLGDAAARSAAGNGVAYGAFTLFLFGLALSAPLILAVYTRVGRRLLDAIVRLSSRMPRWTGAVLVALGLWSIGLAWQQIASL